MLHRVETTITERAVFGRGRPPTHGPRPTVNRFVLSCRINEDREAVEREQTLAGCFVLLTTLPAEGEGGMDARAILSIYKGQHCVEQNFAFLKDPLVVNDLFLKSPARIEVLGMILILALLVWRLMERSLRLRVENEGETLAGWRGRRTERPTTFMMSKLLVGVQTVKIKGMRYLIRPPGPQQREYLKAL